MGELERMTQFKDKGKGNAERAGVGLFTYPVLMASDILLYQTDLVPVGQDQKQHLELTRDLAERFNRDFGETFVVPDPFIPPARHHVAARPGKEDVQIRRERERLDLSSRRCRHYHQKDQKRRHGFRNRDKVRRSRPAITNLLTIYQLLTGKTDECEAHFEGKGYGHFKRELAEAAVEYLRPFQERVKKFEDRDLEEILSAGADKARNVASETLKSVYARMGIK